MFFHPSPISVAFSKLLHKAEMTGAAPLDGPVMALELMQYTASGKCKTTLSFLESTDFEIRYDEFQPRPRPAPARVLFSRT